ncbi:MAG: transposase [Candidatus Poribacteria bacterium]
MAGRFEGLSEIEWKLFSNLFPVLGKWEKGKPATDPRRVLNMLLYLLFTGCRWYDVPRGPYGSPKVPLGWLQRWYEDGTMALLQARILGLSQNHGIIKWSSGAVDASFSPGQRWWSQSGPRRQRKGDSNTLTGGSRRHALISHNDSGKWK